ncbi:hypothetical protein BN1088_1431621 [Sphingobacterium sp. PM2-P1-29]|nr:hypothetical protein BN1088_1431621 [Sphingobacterium sp. PM2-P1-29]
MKTEASKATNNTSGTENKTDNSKTTKAPVQKAVDPAKEKADLKQQVKKEKLVHNLDETLELLEELQKKMRKRGTLLNTINKLNKFEFELEQEEDEMGGDQFNDCSLSIRDDHNNRFETKNPMVIEAVSAFIREICTDKLAEIEANIVLP